MKPQIQIIIDNPLRDLPAGVLLAAHLAAKDCSAILTPFDNAPAETFRLKPHYLLANYARKTNELYLKRLISAKIPMGVLDTEGGVFIKLEEEGGKPNFIKTLTQDKNVIKKIQDYFVWGNFIYHFMQDYWPEAKQAIRLFGTPRTDALHPKWAPPARKKDLILINTSFTLVNTKFRSTEAELEDNIKRFGYSREAVMAAYEDQKKVTADFIEAVKYLIQQLPNETFVLRPHPFERHDMYLESFKDFKNITVNGEYTIDYWLGRAKALFHFECSTALEAALVSVPAFSMRAAAQHRPIEVISLLTDYCDSHEELLHKMKLVLANQYSNKPEFQVNVDKVIKDIYYLFDGNASQRISDHLSEKIKNLNPPRSLTAFLWQYFYQARNFTKKLMGKEIVRASKKFTMDQVIDSLKRFQNSEAKVSSDLGARVDGDSIVIEKI